MRVWILILTWYFPDGSYGQNVELPIGHEQTFGSCSEYGESFSALNPEITYRCEQSNERTYWQSVGAAP